jgi:putative ABC transport system permease protein
MDPLEIFRVAVDSIRANKLRSILTTLGIVIGVLTVISMQTFLEGLNNSVTRELQAIGSNTFYVQKYPAMSFDISKFKNRKNIELHHADAINRRASLVNLVSPEAVKFGTTVRYKREKTNPDVFLLGTDENWAATNAFFVENGRFLTPVDLQYRRPVCTLGLTIVEKLFPFEDPLDKEVLIDGNRFTVVGIMEEKGTFFGQNRDNLAFIPISTFEKLYGEKRSLQIGIKARTPEILEEAMDEVIGILRVERGVPPGAPNDFEIMTRDSLMDSWRNLTSIVFAAALGICLISLLVGGIGVMNIMLVSVTERTREIGLRKAVGARRRDILLQFIAEAVVICEIGGLIGVLIGLGVGKLIGAVTSLPVAVPIWSIIVGLGFVSIVGLFFGIYPAAKAARLRPIDALGYE